MSIRWKILATCLVVVFVPVYFLNRYAIRTFDRFTSRTLEEKMIDEAFIVAEEYRRVAASLPNEAERAAFAERLTRYGREFGTRLRVVTPDGRTAFDSDPQPGESPDVSDRREIRKALSGQYGSRAALTQDRAYYYYYVALPVMQGDAILAAAYASRHTGTIMTAILRMVQDQRLATVASLAAAGLLAMLLAQTLTRRLRRLTRSARAFAAGQPLAAEPWQGRDEIAELGRALSALAAESDRRRRATDAFLAAMAHELRTPLTAIRGAADVLEQGAAGQPDARARFLGNIRFEADRLLRLAGELSDLMKLETESLRGRLESMDYGGLIRDILQRLEPGFEPDRARLILRVPDSPLPVAVAPGRIEQVLANLLENAFRYTPSSGEVELAVRLEGRDILTSVRDTGPGIPAAILPRIFEPFFTTEPRDQARDYGSGLGLAIAQTIVENHGGRIWAKSLEGQGACFCFSLPLAS